MAACPFEEGLVAASAAAASPRRYLSNVEDAVEGPEASAVGAEAGEPMPAEGAVGVVLSGVGAAAPSTASAVNGGKEVESVVVPYDVGGGVPQEKADVLRRGVVVGCGGLGRREVGVEVVEVCQLVRVG